MSLPELCIRRPVMTTLLMLAFVIFGLFSYRLLPVAAIPKVDFPTIVVNATLPGASPETMAASVATPLERQFDGLVERSRRQLDHDAVRPVAQHRRRGARRAIGAHLRGTAPADPDDDAAELHQGEPRRRAGHLPQPLFGNAAALRCRRIRRDAHCPAYFDAAGR